MGTEPLDSMVRSKRLRLATNQEILAALRLRRPR